jgi:hypothetical protein
MASHYQQSILTFNAGGAIALGKAVTLDATGKIVSAANAATDKSVGLCQNAVAASGDKAEVALPGGGGKALLGGTVSAGDLLAPTTGGALIATTTATNRWIAIAMEDGVSGDIISVQVDAGLI